ncbi:hypothetical protein D3C80_874150 [compost metagenome]
MNCHHRRCDRHFNEFQDYSGSAAIPVTLAKIENAADTETDSRDETHCNHDDPPDHESALQGSPTKPGLQVLQPHKPEMQCITIY